MQLFTGLRDSEVKKLEWKDCDFRKKTITISVNKSDRTHIIPMGCFLYDDAITLDVIKQALLCFFLPQMENSICDIRKQNLKGY